MIANNDRFDALDGYRVITPSGKLIGEVASVTETAIIVHLRSLGRSIYRPLPRELALVWKYNRTVIAQISPRELRAALPARHQALNFRSWTVGRET